MTIIPIVASAYIATNVDNFILFVALLARYRNHTSNVVAGYLTCMLFLGFVGYWIGAAANLMPVEFLGLLGFVPVRIPELACIARCL